MQAICDYEINHLKQCLSPNTQANLLILGDEIPPQLWNRYEWHGILSIQEQHILKLNIPQIRAHHHELPLLADSIDFVVVYHALDFAVQTKMILKELWRILAPEGKLIIIGYNPKALFGLPEPIQERFNTAQNQPIHAISSLVKQQGFTQENYKTFYFQPPIKNKKLLNKLSVFEMIGKFCWPYWGMVYLLIANKPLLTLTPVKKQKKPKLHFAMKSLAAPTHRSKVG
jgi:ubiquinone/menaquinone biosynthesis C-methylase UbiE